MQYQGGGGGGNRYGGGGNGGGRGGGGGGGFQQQRSGGGRRDDAKPADFQDCPNAEEFCKLFLGGLHPTTTEDEVKEYFSKYGDIVDCIVMRDPQTKR